MQSMISDIHPMDGSLMLRLMLWTYIKSFIVVL